MSAPPARPPIAPEIERLVHAALTAPSGSGRLLGLDVRPDAIAALAALAQSGEFRVLPALLPLLARDGTIAAAAARTIAALVDGLDPARLAWVDERARPGWTAWGSRDDWTDLKPLRVTWIARQQPDCVGAMGLLACHPSGYVRGAALTALDGVTDGRELPFLALRANDWVAPVAEAAESMLLRRLVPDNRPAVVAALPFLFRLRTQRRRDLASLTERLRGVLLSDDGRTVLSAMKGFPGAVRRMAFEIVAPSPEAPNAAVLEAALADDDAGVRRAAVQWLAAGVEAGRSFERLERVAAADPVSAVRRVALTRLAERAPARVAAQLPEYLLDRAAGVRDLARYLARDAGTPIVARRFYAERLADASSAKQLAAAIDGLGETGAAEDATLVAPFLEHAAPAVRRAALRSLAALTTGQGVSAALAALGDPAGSVHATAFVVLQRNARAVDVEALRRHARALTDATRRLRALRLLAAVGRWDAAVLLLEALGDPDAAVRAGAADQLRAWDPVFTRPGPAQVQRLQHLLDACDGIPADVASRLRLALKTAGVSLSS